MESKKPDNPYRKESICWKLVEQDFSTYTVDQIADELFTDPENIRKMMHKIKQKTGYVVPYSKK